MTLGKATPDCWGVQGSNLLSVPCALSVCPYTLEKDWSVISLAMRLYGGTGIQVPVLVMLLYLKP